MSTATLTKPRDGGAQAAQTASVGLPEKLTPARATLAAKLDQIERAMGDLSGFTAQVERATVAENRAMDDEALSETEAMEVIGKARLQKDVLKARMENRSKAIATLGKEFITAVTGGSKELRGLVNAELSRREGIIGDRVVAALQVGNAIDPKRMTNELAELLHFSGPIQAIHALAPPGYVDQGNTANLVGAAKDILSKFEGIIKEAAKPI